MYWGRGICQRQTKISVAEKAQDFSRQGQFRLWFSVSKSVSLKVGIHSKNSTYLRILGESLISNLWEQPKVSLSKIHDPIWLWDALSLIWRKPTNNLIAFMCVQMYYHHWYIFSPLIYGLGNIPACTIVLCQKIKRCRTSYHFLITLLYKCTIAVMYLYATYLESKIFCFKCDVSTKENATNHHHTRQV